MKTLCDFWEQDRRDLPHATDGVVAKIDDLRLQGEAGFTQKAARWAIALKYDAEEAPSRLLRLACQFAGALWSYRTGCGQDGFQR